MSSIVEWHSRSSEVFGELHEAYLGDFIVARIAPNHFVPEEEKLTRKYQGKFLLPNNSCVEVFGSTPESVRETLEAQIHRWIKKANLEMKKNEL